LVHAHQFGMDVFHIYMRKVYHLWRLGFGGVLFFGHGLGRKRASSRRRKTGYDIDFIRSAVFRQGKSRISPIISSFFERFIRISISRKQSRV